MSLPSLTGVSYAYPDIPASERARLAVAGSAAERLSTELAEAGHRVFFLSTCLRAEVAVEGDRRVLEAVMAEAFPRAPSLNRGSVRTDRELIAHLFRVASGVESPLLGEPEVLGQFRAAVEQGRRAGSVGGLFERVLSEAIQVGREVRSLLPDSPRGSLARVAAQLCGGTSRVAVLGAGRMGRAVIEALGESPQPPAVTIFARRPEAVSIPNVEVESLEKAELALRSFPAVVSATSAKGTLAVADALGSALLERSEPLLLIDLAMPPDFRPGDTVPGLRYVGVDELARMATPSDLSRQVEAHLDERAEQLARRLAAHRAAGPIIEAMLARADQAVTEEVERFAPRIEADAGQREVLHQLAHTVARRILHAPVSFLSTRSGGAEVAEALARAFEVDPDD